MAAAAIRWAFGLGVAAGLVEGCAEVAMAPSGTVVCRGVPVGVSVAGARDGAAQAICEGARDAFHFLAPLGLAQPLSLAIEAVESMPQELGRGVVGCFDSSSDRVVILRHDAFERRGRWLGVEPDLAVYRSVVAHEVTHAILRCHLADDDRLPRIAHEYAAYVVMLATLDPARLDLVLAAYPGEGVDHVSQITVLSYVFDPVAFGVEAFRHWRRQPDGLGFLRDVIEGKLIREMDID
jgi:hypothetical protein